MSLFGKVINSVRLSEDEYEDDYDDYEDEEEYEEERRGLFGFGKRRAVENTSESSSNITPMRGGKGSSNVKVNIMKPTSSNDFKEIADALLNNGIIILDVEGMPHDEAQRIIDFMIGACYAIDGNLQKINNFIFIITPHAVSLSGDIKGLVEAFEGARMNGSGLQTF